MKTVSGSYFSFSNLCFEPSYSTNGLALRILYDKNKSASLNEKERERENVHVCQRKRVNICIRRSACDQIENVCV